MGVRCARTIKLRIRLFQAKILGPEELDLQKGETIIQCRSNNPGIASCGFDVQDSRHVTIIGESIGETTVTVFTTLQSICVDVTVS